jgi:hypothetical protein
MARREPTSSWKTSVVIPLMFSNHSSLQPVQLVTLTCINPKLLCPFYFALNCMSWHGLRHLESIDVRAKCRPALLVYTLQVIMNPPGNVGPAIIVGVASGFYAFVLASSPFLPGFDQLWLVRTIPSTQLYRLQVGQPSLAGSKAAPCRASRGCLHSVFA